MTNELPVLNPEHQGALRGAPSPGVSRAVKELAGWLSSSVVGMLTLVIRAYQLTISPAQTFLFGATGGCRYTPSCSAYAIEALREHGPAGGTMLTVKRICRCHPWGGCGADPVPPKDQRAGVGSSQVI
jgi:putative membrane protein insertion efficiency factor